MANQAVVFKSEQSQSNSAYYDRPNHSILSDIDPNFNYLNTIKKSITLIIIMKPRSKTNTRKTAIFLCCI